VFYRWGSEPHVTALAPSKLRRVLRSQDAEGLIRVRDGRQRHGRGPSDLPAPEADTNQTANPGDDPMEDEGETKPPAREQKREFVATVHDVNEGFDSVSTLRYSQLTHLQGAFSFPSDVTLGSAVGWGSARALPSSRSAPAAFLAVLAVWNLYHMIGRLLDGTILLPPGGGSSFFEPLLRPNLLIIDTERASVSNRQKSRGVALLGTQDFGPIQNKRSNTLTSDCVAATLPITSLATPSSFPISPSHELERQ
jgi:cleavage and polyadenylation specificity factor subunit 2